MSSQNANVLSLGKTPVSTVFKLSWPTILEQTAFTVLNFADTAMVGALGAVYTAAVGITSPVLWLAGGIIAATGVGFSVQIAQSVGAGDMRRASRAVGQSLLAATVAGLLLMIIGMLLSPVLPTLLGADPEVRSMASSYFFVMSLSTLINSFEMTISSTLRSVGDTKSPMVANSISIILNIILNYLFIYPTHTVNLLGRSFTVWGAGFGVTGAALGSLLSILAAVILLIKPFLSKERGISFTKEDLTILDSKVLHRAFELGAPVALERITLSLGQVVYMRIISTMGTIAVAAHHLAVQAESLSYLPASGFSIAATTLVGQSIGADDKPLARRFGQISANMSATLMGLTGILLFFFAETIISLFTPDAAVVAMGGACLRIVAFAQPPEAYATVYAGALRGAGDSRWPFYINLVGVWGFRICLSLIFVFGFGLGLRSVWVAMFCDLLFRGLVCRKRFLNNILR